MKSIIKQIESVLREQWDREALTDWGSEVSFTYGSVATRICYMHLLFESLGIVAICNRNCSHWAVSMLAVLTYRAVAVPLLPDYSKEQLKMLCEHCDAKFMIANHQLANLWPDGKCPMYMLDVNDLLAMTPSAQTDGVERKAFSIFAERYPNGYQAEDVHFEAEQPDDLMVLSYTSGSTGNPKGVMLPWRSLQSNMEFAFQALPCEHVSDSSHGPYVRIRLRLPVWHPDGGASVYPDAYSGSAIVAECFCRGETRLFSLCASGDGENHQGACDARAGQSVVERTGWKGL